ncbi:MAG: hypothetical protein QXO74_02925 [Candidatus Methanomethylicia archaeon]
MRAKILIMMIPLLLILNSIVLAAIIKPTMHVDFSGWLNYVGDDGLHVNPYAGNYFIVEFEYVHPWPKYDGVWLMVEALNDSMHPVAYQLFNQYYQRTFIFIIEGDVGRYLHIVYYYWNGLGEAPEVYYAGYIDIPGPE